MKLDVTNAAFQSSCQEASLSVDGASPHYDERRFSDLELTILVCKALRVWSEQRNAVNRRSIGTPYRRAKGTPLLRWWVVDAGRGFRAAGGVGRA